MTAVVPAKLIQADTISDNSGNLRALVSFELETGQTFEVSMTTQDSRELIASLLRAEARAGDSWAIDMCQRYGGLF